MLERESFPDHARSWFFVIHFIHLIKWCLFICIMRCFLTIWIFDCATDLFFCIIFRIIRRRSNIYTAIVYLKLNVIIVVDLDVGTRIVYWSCQIMILRHPLYTSHQLVSFHFYYALMLNHLNLIVQLIFFFALRVDAQLFELRLCTWNWM
jgi:hypothetical protein